MPARKNFLLPVKALSKIFRAKFRDALRQDPCFADIPASVWEQEWVVHCQPVGNGVGALKYLAPYIFRVAISNNRILKLSNGKVTFRYRASDTGKLRTCTLSAEEFIRRFLQHVLPRGFVKVRYYGFLGSGLRARLAAVHQQLSRSPITSAGTGTTLSTSPKLGEKPSTGPVVYCPSCGRVMRRRPILRPKGRCQEHQSFQERDYQSLLPVPPARWLKKTARASVQRSASRSVQILLWNENLDNLLVPGCREQVCLCQVFSLIDSLA